MPLCHLLAVGLGWLAAAGVALPASAADRVTAVGQLADYPSAVAASLVVKLGLASLGPPRFAHLPQ